MSTVAVFCRFKRTKPRVGTDGEVCVRGMNSETFIFENNNGEQSTFSFDRVFYQDSMQDQVYEFVALPVVRDAFSGVNGAIIAYGQTGAGKNYTLEGTSIFSQETRGLIPRVILALLDFAARESKSISLQMVEIYNEEIRDLLHKNTVLVPEVYDENGAFLPSVTEVDLPPDEMGALRVMNGARYKKVELANTMKIHDRDVKSHYLYIISICRQLPTQSRVKEAKLVLVAMPGSDNRKKNDATSTTEAMGIEQSFTALEDLIRNVPSGLSTKLNKTVGCGHKSNLTEILQHCMRGASKLMLLCCCSPIRKDAEETSLTLQFGKRAKDAVVSNLEEDTREFLSEKARKIIKETELPSSTGPIGSLADLTDEEWLGIPDFDYQENKRQRRF